MIQYIEKLKTERQSSAFPAGYFGVLHHGEIGIEIRWTAETVPSLRKGNQRATAGISRKRQVAGVEVGFASCLQKQRTWTRYAAAIRLDEKLWWQARMEIQFKSRISPAF
jgi:hypothetical protein